MKLFGLSVASLLFFTQSTFASLKGIGELHQIGGRADGTTDYVCVFKTKDKQYELKATLDTKKQTLSMELEQPLVYLKETKRVRLTGAYTHAEVETEGQPKKQYYSVVVRVPFGYEYVLTFTEGKTIPEFQINYGAGSYLCR